MGAGVWPAGLERGEGGPTPVHPPGLLPASLVSEQTAGPGPGTDSSDVRGKLSSPQEKGETRQGHREDKVRKPNLHPPPVHQTNVY